MQINKHKVDGINKLIPDIDNKVTYVLHYRNLQLYLSLGMKCIKVHIILKYKQSGKTMKNIRKRVDVRLIMSKFIKMSD